MMERPSVVLGESGTAGTEQRNSNTPPAPPPGEAHRDEALERAALVVGSDAYCIKQIKCLDDDEMPFVLFVGVETAGKTWLLQRMKFLLQDTYMCVPTLAISETEVTSEQVSKHDLEGAAEDARNRSNLTTAPALTDLERAANDEAAMASNTGRSGGIVVHRFLRPQPGESFALIDVPGEQFVRLSRGEYSGLRGLLAALQKAKSIIVALPADVVLLGKGATKPANTNETSWRSFANDRELAGLFRDGIGKMTAARSIIEQERIEITWKNPDTEEDPTGYEGRLASLLTPQNVESHIGRGQCLPIGGAEGLDCPAFFALTKADRIFATMNAMPDAARLGTMEPEEISSAHQAIGATEMGQLLAKLYARSPLNAAIKRRKATPLKWLPGFGLGSARPITELSNPPELVRTQDTGLFNRLADYVPLGRYDLVSAFYGNTKNSLTRSDLEEMGSLGIAEMIDWLRAVNDGLLNHRHAWARAVFDHIYGKASQSGPTGSGRQNNAVQREVEASQTAQQSRYAKRRRIRFTPRPLLKSMFSKGALNARWLPGGLTVAAFLSMGFATHDPISTTSHYADGETYRAFVAALQSAPLVPDGQRAASALVDLPIDPQRSPEGTARSVFEGLSGWTGNPVNGGYDVKEFVAALPTVAPPAGDAVDPLVAMGAQQRAWRNERVCTLSGWGDFREIVRLAAINGYSECSLLQRLAMQSPAIEWLGPIGGLLALLLGGILFGALAWFSVWFHKTRKAFAWLYHSATVTSQRNPVPD